MLFYVGRLTRKPASFSAISKLTSEIIESRGEIIPLPHARNQQTAQYVSAHLSTVHGPITSEQYGSTYPLQRGVPLRMVMLMKVRTSGVCWRPAERGEDGFSGGSRWSQHRRQYRTGGREGGGTAATRGTSNSTCRTSPDITAPHWEAKRARGERERESDNCGLRFE